MRWVVSLNSIWKPNKFLCEEIGYQNALRECIIAQGDYVPFKIVKRGGRGSFSKENRINQMSPFFESGKFYAHEDELEFFEQYVAYPSVPHDDIMDALEMIFSEVQELPSYGNITLTSQSFQQELQSFITPPISKFQFSHFNFLDSLNISSTSSPYQF
jgi:hypothetical protein